MFFDRASRYNLVNKTNLVQYLFLIYFVNLYMFRAYLGPSSGETTVFIRHLVPAPCITDRITSTKFRINTVVSPDDGPKGARNM
jgi:hypothetical protein